MFSNLTASLTPLRSYPITVLGYYDFTLIHIKPDRRQREKGKSCASFNAPLEERLKSLLSFRLIFVEMNVQHFLLRATCKKVCNCVCVCVCLCLLRCHLSQMSWCNKFNAVQFSFLWLRQANKLTKNVCNYNKKRGRCKKQQQYVNCRDKLSCGNLCTCRCRC